MKSLTFPFSLRLNVLESAAENSKQSATGFRLTIENFGLKPLAADSTSKKSDPTAKHSMSAAKESKSSAKGFDSAA
jgi:hypothetical protein